MSKIRDSTKAKREQDLFFIKKVQDHKELLLSKGRDLSGSKTNEAKTRKWKEIRDMCILNGNTKLKGNTADYIRDNVFGVFKSRTVKKWHDYKKARVSEDKLTEISFF
jgi:hypothetical protein